jgi:putative ABC transport system substrate-binding protein
MLQFAIGRKEPMGKSLRGRRGGSSDAFFAHGAVYVDKVLRGEVPSRMPMEQPMEFDLTVNLKVAKELGVTIPQSILLRATRVIE